MTFNAFNFSPSCCDLPEMLLQFINLRMSQNIPEIIDLNWPSIYENDKMEKHLERSIRFWLFQSTLTQFSSKLNKNVFWRYRKRADAFKRENPLLMTLLSVLGGKSAETRQKSFCLMVTKQNPDYTKSMKNYYFHKKSELKVSCWFSFKINWLDRLVYEPST